MAQSFRANNIVETTRSKFCVDKNIAAALIWSLLQQRRGGGGENFFAWAIESGISVAAGNGGPRGRKKGKLGTRNCSIGMVRDNQKEIQGVLNLDDIN